MLETNVGPGEKRQNDIKIRQKKRKERGGGKERKRKRREKKREKKRGKENNTTEKRGYTIYTYKSKARKSQGTSSIELAAVCLV